MRFRLSKCIPVRMVSRYQFRKAYWPDNSWFPERATWWQWRGHIWAHHRTADFAQWFAAPGLPEGTPE